VDRVLLLPGWVIITITKRFAARVLPAVKHLGNIATVLLGYARIWNNNNFYPVKEAWSLLPCFFYGTFFRIDLYGMELKILSSKDVADVLQKVGSTDFYPVKEA